MDRDQAPSTSSVPSVRQQLETIAQNLWWTWHTEVQELFRDLDPGLWKATGHDPIAFLRQVSGEQLEHHARTAGLEGRIHAMARRLDRYLADEHTWCHDNAGALRAKPVAYFSAEYGMHEALPLYSGGLGVLSGDHLKSASDLGIPLVAVGILYTQGYFIQRLDGDGWQQEEFHHRTPEQLPITPCLDAHGQPLTIEVPTHEHTIRVRIWRAEVGRVTLYLLDTDLEGNDPAFRDVTHRLYWGDQESRIRQELVLGVGGMRALHALGIRPGVFHLNEGHSSFALLEAARIEMEDNGVDRDEALHRVGRHAVFTTHTPVPAGHDRFPPEMLLHHLGWLGHALGISDQELLAFGRENVQDRSETFCMTVLALKLAHRANGVAAMHGDISRRMWKNLYGGNAPGVPIGHVSNGVNVSTWMANEWKALIERHAGLTWSTAFGDEETSEELERLDPDEIWETHAVMKDRLITFARERFAAQEVRRGASPEEAAVRAAGLLDPNALTIGFARRFATYKRATLMLSDRERLKRMLTSEDRPVQIIISGKSHPRDDGGKKLIQEIAQLQKDPSWKGRIVFLENYDMEVGRTLVQGVDVWLNNPRRWEEASGTSGMKVVLNGGLNCSISDGWWHEGYDGRNGFLIDSPGPHANNEIQDARDAEALYRTLEEEVVPAFFDRDASGLPMGWIQRQRHAFRTLARRFSSDRMVRDYATDYYLPAALVPTSERR